MEKWLRYEDKFREIVSKNLSDFGLTSVADAKQDYEGKITSWNIDVSGYAGQDLVVYECRDRKRKPIKPDLGEFAFRLDDLNAKGFVVSPKGLTSGRRRSHLPRGSNTSRSRSTWTRATSRFATRRNCSRASAAVSKSATPAMWWFSELTEQRTSGSSTRIPEPEATWTCLFLKVNTAGMI